MSRKGLNIYKRKDGRWEARYIKSRNALGKPKYGYLYASSYREVRCDLQHTLQLQGKPSGSEERTRNSTFELVSMEWLDAFSINFKESTYIRYRTLIECYLMPSFQTVKIEKITKEMVRKLCKHLELHGKKDKTGLSPKTIPYNVPTYVSGKSIVALADGANKFQLIEAADEDDRSPALGADNEE